MRFSEHLSGAFEREPPDDHEPDDHEPDEHEPDDQEPDELHGDELPDDELDEDFPLGDGTAETDAVVFCPYCGESVEIALDPGSGAVQEYVEDCEVCCQPWRVHVAYDEDGQADVSVSALDE